MGLNFETELGPAPALDALLEALPDGSTVINLAQADGILRNYQSTLDGLEAFGPDSVPGVVFRSLGLASGVVGTFGSASQLLSDPSLERAAAVFVDSVSTLQDATAIFEDFGALGVAGGALALLGSGALAGPIGIVLSLGTAVGSIGVNQYHKAEISNRYTGEEAKAVLGLIGFNENAQDSLANRSGEGYNAVTLLYRYGELHGLSAEQTVDWINSLLSDQLDEVRDQFHRKLDESDGDTEVFKRTAEGDDFYLEALEHTPTPNPGLFVPDSKTTADAYFESQGIPLPS